MKKLVCENFDWKGRKEEIEAGQAVTTTCLYILICGKEELVSDLLCLLYVMTGRREGKRGLCGRLFYSSTLYGWDGQTIMVGQTMGMPIPVEN